MKAGLKLRGHIVLVCRNADGSLAWRRECRNLVTTAGALHFSQVFLGLTPTNPFDIMELGTAGDVPSSTSDRSNISAKVANSQKAFDATYPKLDDQDTDNPGRGPNILTWLCTYGSAEANDASPIDRAFITNASPGVTEPLFDYGVIPSPATKSVGQTLKQFINITPAGA